MLFEVGEFCQRVESDLAGLVDDLQQLTGRFSGSEKMAWAKSLPKLSVVLAKPELETFHLSLNDPGAVALEYRLPASSSWCDAVLLGRGNERPAAVILELKDWDLTGDRPGPREALVIHQGREELHPSDQVRGYVEYCQKFHSTVHEAKADVHGCVFFVSRVHADAYRAVPHDQLTATFPVFTGGEEEVSGKFVPFLRDRVTRPDMEFARAFDTGTYRQDRNFISQIAEAIQDVPQSPFVLLDEQRRGYEYCLERIDQLLSHATDEKLVVIIQGPPGSGKSVLAAHLWAALAKDPRIRGNVVFTTTSGCQRKNWEHLFAKVAHTHAGRGVVLPANRFNPGLSAKWVKEQRSKGEPMRVSDWKQNLRHFSQLKQPKIGDDTFEVTVVDEAHALIDPTAPGAEGVPPSGWSMHAGPQAWHIIRCSRVSVFLMDSEQSYRDNETTTPESIRRIAMDHNVARIEEISLANGQFRCGGSREYLGWLEDTLRGQPSSFSARTWRQTGNGHQRGFNVDIVDDPQELDDHLAQHIAKGHSARLVASYARKWVTKGITSPHSLPDKKKDFCIVYHRHNNKGIVYSKIWNYVPEEDYTAFIQAPPGSSLAAAPLAEVGCPYVIRGFDFDFLGVLWLSDLVWRKDQWVAQIEHVHETAWPRTRRAARDWAKHHSDSPQLLHRLQRGYRILLSLSDPRVVHLV